MDSHKLLIVGASGQLGRALQSKYPAATAADSSLLDISNRFQVENFDWSGVELIFNAAAYTNVDGAETPEGRRAAWQVNAVGTANLVRIAVERNLTLVHVSTDYVFDGTQDPHTEDEPLSPLGVYGQSKAAGDVAVSLVPKHYLLRTSWVIGEGKNFVQTMLGLGQRGIEPTVVADQIGRPTFTGELANAAGHLLTSGAAYGTYNVTNGGDSVSWADLTREIFKQAGYDLAVTDTTTEAYFASKPSAAPRPLKSRLLLDKLQATGFTPTDWRQDLAHYIANTSKEADS